MNKLLLIGVLCFFGIGSYAQNYPAQLTHESGQGNYTFDFTKPVGFSTAESNKNEESLAGNGTTGGAGTGKEKLDTMYVSTTSDLCKIISDRRELFRGKTPEKLKYFKDGSLTKNPLTIIVEAGNYTQTGDLASVLNANMLDIAGQRDLTVAGRGDVVFKGFGINVNKATCNLIIRNITFENCPDDGVNIGDGNYNGGATAPSGCVHHIWVDHCTFWDGPNGDPTTDGSSDGQANDGALDVKHAASYVTVSWCEFKIHSKTCLLGHSDGNSAEDNGRLKTTYINNYFHDVYQRCPRVRFAEAHVVNNLYENVGIGRTQTVSTSAGSMGYGVAISNNSQVYVEGNFFVDTRWPMVVDWDKAKFRSIYGAALLTPCQNYPGKLYQTGNEYDDSGLTISLTSKVLAERLNPGGKSIRFDDNTDGFTFNPSAYYTYETLPAQVVKEVIPLYAGANKINFFQSSSGVTNISKTVENCNSIIYSASSNVLTVSSESEGNLFISDINGKTVFSKTLQNNKEEIELASLNLSKGFYIVSLRNTGSQKSVKIIIR